jgi:hypothetical protein
MSAVDERYRRYVAGTMEKRIPAILRTAAQGFDSETKGRLKAIGGAISMNAPMIADLARWPFHGWEQLPTRVNGKRVRDESFFDFEYWFYCASSKPCGLPSGMWTPSMRPSTGSSTVT